MLQNEYLVTKIGVDSAEIGLSEVGPFSTGEDADRQKLDTLSELSLDSAVGQSLRASTRLPRVRLERSEIEDGAGNVGCDAG